MICILIFYSSFSDAYSKTSGLNYIVSVGKNDNTSIPYSKNYIKGSESQKDLLPFIHNFSIQNDQPTRVYFESNVIITANSFKGFKIGDKRINSITISSGNKTGHYFTVNTPFTFWDNELIRYEGGSDLVNLEGQKLYEFTLRYILNMIEEPKTNQNYFVSVDGNDSNNGLTEETAWRTISKAGLQAIFGSTVWIKAGDYGAENVIIKNSGLQNKPIKFIGYKDKLNDIRTLKRTIEMPFKSSEMPLIKNGEGIGISCKSKHLIIRNIQIENYTEYGIRLNKTTYFIADNIFIKGTKRGIKTRNKSSTNNRVINSYVANSSQNGVHLQNKNNLIDNTWSVSSKVVGMDYYITLYGGDNGNGNIIRNCYVKRFPDDSHSGHGISLKSDQHMRGFSLEYNLVEDCTITGSRLELRHRSVKNNVYRNILIEGGNGININDGAAYNTFENVTVKNSVYFTQFYESVENGGTNENGNHNRFINCVGDTCDQLITTSNYPKDQPMEQVIQYNEWINCTFTNITNLYYPNSRTGNPDVDASNRMTNCIFSNCPRLGPGDQDIIFSYSDFHNGFPPQSGTGNFSTNPSLDSNYEPQVINSNLNVPRISGIYYDKNDSERFNPTTAGAIEKNR